MKIPSSFLYGPKSDDARTASEYITYKNVWFGFTGTATTHGIQQIQKARGYFKRVIWILAFLGCTVGFTYQLYSISALYSRFNVSPIVVKQNARLQEFPAVSVCNTNPIKSSALHLSPRLQALIDSWQKKSRRRRSIDVLDVYSAQYESRDKEQRSHRVKRSGVCPALLQPGNGYFKENGCSAASSVSGAICTAICNNGYDILRGNSVVQCQTDGTWNMTERPCCESSCTQSLSGLPCGMTMGNLNTEVSMQNREVIIWFELTVRKSGNITQWRYYAQRNHTFYPSIWRALADGSYQLIGYNNITSEVINSEQIVDVAPENQINATAGDCLGVILENGTALYLATEAINRTRSQYILDIDLLKHRRYNEIVTFDQNNGQYTYRTRANNNKRIRYSAVSLVATVETSCDEETTTSTTSTTVSTTTPFSIYPEREPLREDFKQETEVTEVLADLPVDVKKKMGYELYDLVLSCQYEHRNCNMSEFGYFFDAVYGNCYVFNSGFSNSTDKYKSTKPGHSAGLKMVLNLRQHEYVKGMSQAAGVVVVVHPANIMPFPEDEGVFAAPGQVTSIGINKVDIFRLPDPYSNCSEETRNPDINVFEEHYNVEYSSTACYKTCYQRYVIQRCKCSDPQYPSGGKAFGGTNWTSCNVRDKVQDDCVYGVQLDYVKDKLECNCPTPCSEVTYRYSLSCGLWPSDAYKDEFVSQYANSMEIMSNYSSTEAFLANNIAKIEVYFNEFDYQRIYEKPKYPIHLYLTDICAILGLWLGISLFSLTEYLEVITDIIIVKLFQFKKQPKVLKEQKQDSPEVETSEQTPSKRKTSTPIRHRKVGILHNNNIPHTKFTFSTERGDSESTPKTQNTLEIPGQGNSLKYQCGTGTESENIYLKVPDRNKGNNKSLDKSTKTSAISTSNVSLKSSASSTDKNK